MDIHKPKRSNPWKRTLQAAAAMDVPLLLLPGGFLLQSAGLREVELGQLLLGRVECDGLPVTAEGCSTLGSKRLTLITSLCTFFC